MSPRLRWLQLGQLTAGIAGPPPAFQALLQALGPGGILADRRPDLVCVTGDLARSGAEAEYPAVDAALEALARAAQLPLGRVVVVPGNRDVDRSRVSRRFVLELPDAQATDEFFAEREDVAVALRRFKPYLQWHQRRFGCALDADRPALARRLTVAGVQLGLVGLNSAWLAHCDDARGRLVVGQAPLAAALAELAAAGPLDLVLGLVHHPPGEWAPFEQATVAPRVVAGCDLVLHGPPDPGIGPWIGAPAAAEGALWVDLFADRVRLTPLVFGPEGLRAGAPRERPLRRPLPAAPVARQHPGPRRPPDLEGYLRHVEDEWGYVLLTGLLKDQAQAAVNVRAVYVSLHSRPPLPEGPVDPAPLEDLLRLLAAPAEDPRALADAGLLRVQAALRAAGLAAEDCDVEAARRAWARLRAAPVADREALLHRLQVVEVDRALAQSRKVLVEGDPGTGKSTTLQRVAVALLDAWRGAPAEATRLGFQAPFPLPLLVPMRRFWAWLTHRPERLAAGGAELLLDYLRASLAQHAGGDAWIAPALAAGEVAVLLDGLDEVPAALDRERAAGCLRDFVRRFEGCWFMITSRPAGLGPAERLALERAGLAPVRIAPLDAGQVRRFLEAWYQALIPDARAARRKARALEARIADNPLTRAPITLIATAIVHHTLGDLPERRAELYEHCVQALCGRWDAAKEEAGARLAGRLGRPRKVRLLQQLALALHSQGQAGQILEPGPALACLRQAAPEEDPPDAEAARELLDLLGARSGLLVPEGLRGWRFCHLTFQEYLAARCLCAEREDAAEVLASRLQDPWWREVVLLAVGYKAKDAAVEGRRLLDRLIDAAEAQDQPEPRAFAHGVVAQALLDLAAFKTIALRIQADRLAPRLVALLADPAQPGALDARVWMAEALGAFGDPRLGFEDDTHLVRVPAGAYTSGDPHGLHPVAAQRWHLPEFRVARLPVTRSQYAAFIDAGGYAEPSLWAAGGPPIRGLAEYRASLDRHPNHPVTEVDWHEACAFCAWLNRSRPRRDGLVWRLPTLREWEKAARGGDRLADGPNPAPLRRYPWGDVWRPDAANGWRLRARDGTTPVGCFPAGQGPYGALDQAGNVDEWCLDPDPERGGRALKGGYFLGSKEVLAVSWHSSEEPTWHSDGVGFRVVAGPPVDLDDPSGLSEPSLSG